MAAAALASSASFAERANQVGVSSEVMAALKAQQFDTFGALAFAVSASPSQMSDDQFDQWLTRIMGGASPSPYQQSCVRRLMFEAYTLSMTEMRQRVETWRALGDLQEAPSS